MAGIIFNAKNVDIEIEYFLPHQKRWKGCENSDEIILLLSWTKISICTNILQKSGSGLVVVIVRRLEASYIKYPLTTTKFEFQLVVGQQGLHSGPLKK
jgi:hypothetical protein